VDEVLDTDFDGPGVMGLPAKFMTWRHDQASIVSQIIGDIVKGHNFVVAELPTGSGKTMISMASRQILEMKTLYVCTTKSLQDQFLSDFPHAKLIKGRANYPCGQLPDKFPDITADDCPAKKCTLACPYAKAKDEAMRARIAVMNMAYFLSEIQHIGAFKGRQLVVIDEADTLEDALLDQVSVQISQFDIDQLGLGEPEFKTKFDSWKAWAEKAKEKVDKETQELRHEIAMSGRIDEDDEDWSTAPIALIRRKKRLERLAAKMGFFLKHVDQYWVWDRQETYARSGKYFKWVFKPVRVDMFGDVIWKAADNFIMMSATILDTLQYERNVGLAKYRDEGRVSFIRMGSVFDASRRPVIVRPVLDLTFKNKESGMVRLAPEIKRILDAHPNEKGIIHTVTYDIAKTLASAFPGRVRIHTSSTRAAVIQEFKSSPLPLVLVSPSIERGEDFPDDLCRFVVVVKAPYPYLGDPRINRRLHSQKDGQKWYTLKTVSKIVQMTGRGMRHEQDSCTSYILDAGFPKLYRQNRGLFPSWWRDSVIQDESKGGVNAKAQGQGQGQAEEAPVREEHSSIVGGQRSDVDVRSDGAARTDPVLMAADQGDWRARALSSRVGQGLRKESGIGDDWGVKD